MIPSVACCKLPSPSFWIAKRCSLLRKYASLTWKASILLFVDVQETSLSSKSQHKKGKRINREVGYGLEIPAEYVIYGNKKGIQWAKRTLDGVDAKVKKKF